MVSAVLGNLVRRPADFLPFQQDIIAVRYGGRHSERVERRRGQLGTFSPIKVIARHEERVVDIPLVLL